MDSDLTSDDDDYTVAMSKRKRKQQLIEKNKNNYIKGAPPPSRQLFIGRIGAGDENTMKKYLKASKVRFEKVEKISHNYAKFKSFKLTLPINYLDQVLGENFWPEGVVARVWKEKKTNLNFKHNSNKPSGLAEMDSLQYYNSKYENKLTVRD